MKVSFRTKDESKKEQWANFLKLVPVDRIYAFLDVMYHLKDFPTNAEAKNNDNFVVEITFGKLW